MSGSLIYLYPHLGPSTMSDKSIAALAIAVIIAVVAASCVVVEFKENDKEENYAFGDPESDFTLLDSPDKIVPGLTLKNLERAEEGKAYTQFDTTVVVDDVADGKVTYSWILKTDSYDSTELEKYAPGQVKVYGLDYTNAPYPEGITVAVDGDTYTINGTWVPQYFTENITFVDFRIVWTGEEVTDVNGKITNNGDSSSGEDDVETVDGTVWEHGWGSNSGTGTADTADFYDTLSAELFTIEKYDADDYTGATVTEGSGKCGNVTCTVYTVNGKSNKYGNVYEDFKLYVYDGYVLQVNGLCDGAQNTGSLSIFVAA